MQWALRQHRSLIRTDDGVRKLEASLEPQMGAWHLQNDLANGLARQYGVHRGCIITERKPVGGRRVQLALLEPAKHCFDSGAHLRLVLVALIDQAPTDVLSVVKAQNRDILYKQNIGGYLRDAPAGKADHQNSPALR